MNRKDYIDALCAHLVDSFLVGVVKGDLLAISALEKNLCKVERDGMHLAVTFNLAKLFDALWWHASLHKILLPAESGWDKDFQCFCRQIMNPWPDDAIKALGYKLELVKKGRGYVSYEYRLSPLVYS